jgi:hypothetical protein
MKYTYRLFASVLILASIVSANAGAQKIAYSEPDRNEVKQTEFEIIGKYNNHFLVYKNYKNTNYISVYDGDMKLKEHIPIEGMPDRIQNSDIIAYPDFSYLFYQYQRKNIVHCMMVQFGPDGKSLSKPIEIDTTQIGMGSADRIYSVIASEDKENIMIFKVNSRDEKRYIFKTLLYSKDLTLLHTGKTYLSMNDRNDFLTDFYLDNDGNLVFGRGLRAGSSENINKFFLIVKPAAVDSFAIKDLKLEGISLDEVKLRMDNFNNRYLFTSFYYKGKRTGSIEGIANAIFDKSSREWIIRNVIPLGQEVREDAKGDNNTKNAFDDYYIQQIYIRKDGGFVIVAESNYQTSRGSSNSFNRWGNMYSPYVSSFDYYRYGSYYPYGYNRWGNSGIVRYHADNIVVGAFDKDGKLRLSNTIHKSQFDDDNDGMVSYQVVNTGEALQFVYNDYEKRDVVLSYQSINASGNVTRPPTLKNLDKGYSFLPRYGKQVSSHTIIIPCLYRNFLCFAKLDL